MPLGDAGIVVPDDVEALELGVEVDGYDMRFFYSFDGDSRRFVTDGAGAPLALDASVLSDEHVGFPAYTGMVVGLSCIDMWDKSSTATFGSFSYRDR